MKKLLLALLLLSHCLLFAQELQELPDVFISNDYEMNSECIPTCREVIKPYRTKVTGFEATSGITRCIVFNPAIPKITSVLNADTLNNNCISETNETVQYDNGELTTEGKSFGEIVNFSYSNNERINFGRFMAGMMTLDPELIDFEATKQTGSLRLKNLGAFYGSNSAYLNKFNGVAVSTIDGFNKENLAYFSNLFNRFSEFYGYVQNYLFVVIGMFFLFSFGGGKLLQVLEKQAQSSNANWLKSFMTPVLTVGIFFAPIPESEGMSATIIQKAMRYFITEGIVIADKMSVAGSEVYMQKIYNSVGGVGVKGEKIIRDDNLLANAESKIYSKALQEVCDKRFGGVHNYLHVSENLAKNHESIYINKQAQDIEFNTCRSIQQNLNLANRRIVDTNIAIQGIEANYNNNKLSKKLTEVNSILQNRQEELGYVTSIILPSYAMTIEQLSLINDNSMFHKQEKVHKQEVNQLYDDMSVAYQGSGVVKNLSDLKGDVASGIGSVMGQTTYFMLPGASGMFNFFKSTKDELIDVIPGADTLLGKTVKGFVGKVADVFILYFVKKIYDDLLEKMPIFFSVICSIIVFVRITWGQLFVLYISPFVVCFSLATRGTAKITDFLLQVIMVSLKPILFVLMIYLALFFHEVVKQIFDTLTQEQLNMIDNIQNEVGLSFFISIVEVIMGFLIPIATSIIMWVIIYSGADYVFKLLGLHNKTAGLMNEVGKKAERISNPVQ